MILNNYFLIQYLRAFPLVGRVISKLGGSLQDMNTYCFLISLTVSARCDDPPSGKSVIQRCKCEKRGKGAKFGYLREIGIF